MEHLNKIFYNGKIITLNRDCPTAEAMLVTGTRIKAIGTLEQVLAQAPPQTKRIDLAGLTAVPGFNDSHMHLLNWGLGLDGVDLTGAHSIAELIALGRHYLQKNDGQRAIIIGRGWSDENFAVKTLPNKKDLDQISTELPVIFTRVCGHVCAANSKALELAGIDSNTAEPSGGSIDRDLAGEPTGILRETAMALLRVLLPTPTISDLKRTLRQAAYSAAALGLTSVQSNDLSGSASLSRELEAYSQLAEAGELPIRINLQATMATPNDLNAYLEAKSEYRDLGCYLSLGPVKLYADGSLGARTAALSHPYTDAPETSGIPLYSQAELEQLVEIAARGNSQVAVHAIGDQALEMVLDSYIKAKETVPGWNARPRIVHCQIARREQLERMAELGIIADIQPIFVPTDRHFVEQRIGAERARYAYAWKTMVELGIPTAGGSDCPVESCNPLLGLQAAITRGGWHTEQCLTPLEALTLFTLGSAYATGEEQVKGSLSPGKLADFVVLPENPLTVDPQELGKMEITATYVGGTQVKR